MHRVGSDSMRSRSANGLRSAHLSIGRATSARRQEDHQTVIDFVQLERVYLFNGVSAVFHQ